MKVAFFTEGRYTQKVKSSNPNLRTDLAWQYHLDAHHHSLHNINTTRGEKYDIGIVIIPKNKTQLVSDVLHILRPSLTKLVFMQEGPNNYWTDYSIEDQINYLKLLHQADFLLCHNDCDISYFEGLTGINTYVMPPVLVEESIPDLHSSNKLTRGAIIGGNMCSWYNGMVSLTIASEWNGGLVSVPSMGRRQKNEDSIQDLEHLPYMSWSDWMGELGKYSVGVHMMPTIAAGTFALNCAYWGIPCIGYDKVDAQNNCHEFTSIDINDVSGAMTIMQKLKDDPRFYDTCSRNSQANYVEQYSFHTFKERMNKIFETEFSNHLIAAKNI